MLGNHPYYNSSMKKYSAVFGTLFNDIFIDRISEDGKKTQRIKIPLTYAPKEKMLARALGDPDIDRESAITLPTMAYDITSLTYDASRKTSSLRKFKPTAETAVYNPVPYNIGYQLQIYTKAAEDGLKILEQILPFFEPDFTVAVEMINGLEPFDVPIVLDSVTTEDSFQGDLKEKRVIMWILNFTIKAKFYGPVTTAKLIRFTKQTLYSGLPTDANIEPVQKVEIQPGLTANGSPTTIAADSIDPELIQATDDWGYVVTVTDYTK
jgi:hypothetical protein